MISLRARLFVILILSTGVIWASAVSWIYLRSRAQLEHVLDTRLQEAARMVSSLVSAAGGSTPQGKSPIAPTVPSYDHQLSCQVWSFDGQLLAKSSGAPSGSLSAAAAGFSDRQVDGEDWRVYVVEDLANGTRVVVGDRLGLRRHLIADLITGLVAPAVLTAPLLGLLIWISVGRGLRPLREMARSLSIRKSDDMRPLDKSRAPPEVRPVADALNTLFARVDAARRHEREFIAFAAHELRTPLTGLRMQAQIAMSSADREIVRSALGQIMIAVDRSARLVKQLLTFARFEAGTESQAAEPVPIGPLVRGIASEIGDRDGAVRTEVDPRLMGMAFFAQRECLELAIRNLQENAVNHTAPGGTIRWSLGNAADTVCIEDEGPGIPEDEIDQVARRFFRGRFKTGIGSGLGLAIVAEALARTGATFRLANRADGRGLRVEVGALRSLEPQPAGS